VGARVTTLLPSDALRGVRVGISASVSADLARLGLLEAHFRLTLGEIARAVLVSGGGLIYGGHFSLNGYTTFLLGELQRYARRDRPLLICLPWQEHRRLPLSDLQQRRKDVGLFGQVICLDPDGLEIDPAVGRSEPPEPERDEETRQVALTSLRRYMRERQHGRVFIGGRRGGFDGPIPGLMEEAVFTAEANQPMYLASGLGGVTLELARLFGTDDGSWLPSQVPDEDLDPRVLVGRQRIRASIENPAWRGLQNGLTEEENRRLALSHRPSEIATLVSLGLGRHSNAAQPRPELNDA
jgi:hypothetical protein